MSPMNLEEDSLSRRHFLEIMGASLALAGLTACTKMPLEQIIPYVLAPEGASPGEPEFYATTGFLSGFAKGILAKSYQGRPTKIEGNPRHPASLGKSDIFMQAELLRLYDPDRAQAVLHLGEVSTWDAFSSSMLAEAQKWRGNQGEGVRILSNRITSPTLLKDIQSFLLKYPRARWHSYEPTEDEQTYEATRLVFDKDVRPFYDFTKARMVLSLDCDFLGPGPAQEIYTRDFMSFRKSILNSENKQAQFNRLYMIESSMTITGACADHRWPVRPSEFKKIIFEIATLLGVPGFSKDLHSSQEIPNWIKEIVLELKANKDHCLIVPGSQQTLEIQALVLALNAHLGNFGKTVQFLPLEENGVRRFTIADLCEDMAQDKVQSLFVFTANPVYDTPSTLQFRENLERVPLRVRLGLYHDETSYLCHWVLPESHFLESWGDGRSYDGTVSLQQPLISSLYETRNSIEVFSILNGQFGRSAHQAVKEYWKKNTPKQKQKNESFEKKFEQDLCNGTVPDTWLKTVSVSPRWDRIASLGRKSKVEVSEPSALALEAVIRPDPTIWDGRYSNNAWLQELPKPILQLTWGNAAILSPLTARKLELNDEDEVELRVQDRVQKATILAVPGHPENSLTLYLGYGRSKSGRVGNGHGYNAFVLQDHRSPAYLSQVKIRKLRTRDPLATTHTHSSMEGRDLVVHGDLDQLKKNSETFVKQELKNRPHTILPKYPTSSKEAWAMVINLTTCIGCKTCTIACQAENNIPVVGKGEVIRAHEMHWIRVDRYYHGNPSRPKVLFQPVPCMHCEKAPCEVVCPTVATSHSSDGLNQMIYNRCVGTRYCSNNCPYKVRRFNFFQYSDTKTPSLRLMYNPEVTVRSRGVMEKCTYCVQRIQIKHIEAEREKRPLKDSEILTACQQACPTDAIIFGDQNDPKSRVSQLKTLPQHYTLLNELGTLPRTTYLALIRNPNSKLEQGSST